LGARDGCDANDALGARMDARTMTRDERRADRWTDGRARGGFERTVYETLTMYERSFPAIGERFFKRSAWPTPEEVSAHANGDATFKMLYGEMYYRHLHQATTPTAEERRGAWENYAAVFEALATGEANMQLPNLWLYDMVDEFVYQYQSFAQFKGSPKRTPEEVSAIKALDAKVWDRAGVAGLLKLLVEKSGIVQVLARERAGENSFAANEGYSATSSNVLPTLGYCAQIGLCRLHVLAGDYEGALAALDAIDLDKEGLFKKISGAYVTTAYHVGFSYFMLGRYTDAIRHLNAGIQYIDRLKFGATRPHALPLLLKRQDQMYALTAIIMALVPGQQHLVDESVSLGLHQKYSAKMNRMAEGTLPVFDELFSYCCPKFIGDGDNHSAYTVQYKLFLEVVAAHAIIPKLRGYFEMYASIKVDKLASLLEVSVDDLKASFKAFEEGYTVKEWRGGASALDGESTYCGDMRIVLEGDVVRAEELKRAKSAKEFLERVNNKLEMSLEDLASAKPLLVKTSAIVG